MKKIKIVTNNPTESDHLGKKHGITERISLSEGFLELTVQGKLGTKIEYCKL